MFDNCIICEIHFLTNTSATFVKTGLTLKGQHCPLVAASSVARALGVQSKLLIRIISSVISE